LNGWKNYFPRHLNVRRFSCVRQTEIHTAEPLVHEPSPFEAEIAFANYKEFKSPRSNQISAKLIQAGGEILLSEIHKLINPIWTRGEMTKEWKQYIIIPI
jgi:hypothetical protein